MLQAVMIEKCTGGPINLALEVGGDRNTARTGRGWGQSRCASPALTSDNYLVRQRGPACNPNNRSVGVKMTRVIALALLTVLAACTTETIYMKNRATGETAICGAHSMAFPIYATIAATHDQECVQNYKDQGFVRTAAPN